MAKKEKQVKKLYKQSETVVIKRSQINFAPYNPKKHSKEQVDEIKRNIKNVAFFGGIVWNIATGNLVDGHKRIMSLDLIHNYDGTDKTDYDVKVEKCELDIKTEKEQNIFQTKSRTDLDLQIVQTFYNEIDLGNTGLNPMEISMITPFDSVGSFDDLSETFNKKTKGENGEDRTEQELEDAKAQVKEMKKSVLEKAAEKTNNTLLSYLTLNFTNFEDKKAFMLRLGIDPYQTFINGNDFSEMVEVII